MTIWCQHTVESGEVTEDIFAIRFYFNALLEDAQNIFQLSLHIVRCLANFSVASIGIFF